MFYHGHYIIQGQEAVALDLCGGILPFCAACQQLHQFYVVSVMWLSELIFGIDFACCNFLCMVSFVGSDPVERLKLLVPILISIMIKHTHAQHTHIYKHTNKLYAQKH